jgi:SAM-dependent methyltransferase
MIFFGSFGKTFPTSKVFGLDRGQPIDRYYIEKFLEKNKNLIYGNVLEIGDGTYTKKYGGKSVIKSDVLHVDPKHREATIIADLTKADHIPSNNFDCIIFTQTLQFIYETKKVIETLNRILKPGGTVLATTSGISQISNYDMDRWGEYWRFTTLSAKKLFEEFFAKENVFVESYGNVLTAVSFLHGLAAEEINPKKLNYNDPNYQVIITIKAIS